MQEKGSAPLSSIRSLSLLPNSEPRASSVKWFVSRTTSIAYLRVLSLFRHSSPRRAASREISSSGRLPMASRHMGLATGLTFFSSRSTRAVNSANFCTIPSALMVLLCHSSPFLQASNQEASIKCLAHGERRVCLRVGPQKGKETRKVPCFASLWPSEAVPGQTHFRLRLSPH